jgi:hypothetical protein
MFWKSFTAVVAAIVLGLGGAVQAQSNLISSPPANFNRCEERGDNDTKPDAIEAHDACPRGNGQDRIKFKTSN